ncbi:MAG: UbiA family prenyltransferase [Verrucomicrobiota bacterium]|nr:UbiA family prenyltransferase [Verrucomicrobiota bacterium]
MIDEEQSTVHKTEETLVANSRPKLFDYIAIARPDHWTKNLFILPGVFLAMLVSKTSWQKVLFPLLIGMSATCLAASANYTINEWLDRHFDRFHPKKRTRPSVSGRVKAFGIYLQYILLIASSLLLAAFLNWPFFFATLFLLVMGVIYNVQPFRSKDRVYLDVISESINNPIRLCMGWFVVISTLMPPSSLILAYWLGGAFLMAVKRYAEFRTIGSREIAGLYRQSFKTYSEESLLCSSVFYAMGSTLFLGVFLIKYRIELLLSFPLIAGLFTWYLRMGMDEDSPAQHPEKLLSQRAFMLYVLCLTLTFVALFVFDIPILHKLLRNTFSEL